MGIQIRAQVANVKGNSCGVPRDMDLKTNSSLAKCPRATTYVHIAML